MNVKHCPKCGSDDISVSSYSAEYMSSTRYNCGNCSWKYKKGRGIGTGSGNSGKHPRKFGSANQRQLVEVGEWCSTCETCAKPEYCKCVHEDQTGFCKTCANFSEYDVAEMHDVKTYFGKYKDSPFICSICEDSKAELKVIQ